MTDYPTIAARDAALVAAYRAGASLTDLHALFSLSVQRCRDLIHREAPGLMRPRSTMSPAKRQAASEKLFQTWQRRKALAPAEVVRRLKARTAP